MLATIHQSAQVNASLIMSCCASEILSTTILNDTSTSFSVEGSHVKGSKSWPPTPRLFWRWGTGAAGGTGPVTSGGHAAPGRALAPHHLLFISSSAVGAAGHVLPLREGLPCTTGVWHGQRKAMSKTSPPASTSLFGKLFRGGICFGINQNPR